ncbi:hypothetical protein [Bacillus cereus]|uniref:hypothetical protein n=1 Tax=Bacillus cereus TaxID=1396 RepID=UPI0001A09D5D|nr:hypothetical protein [Bacillus cereus]EEL49010.1 hypothetical protein bcere0022_36790 [Bacillus cereus Rock3-44]PFO82114.1 hypothetical protein COJ77_13645 [Bacillus cereus]
MSPYYKKHSVTNIPFFPDVSLPELPEIQKPIKLSKSAKFKKTIKPVKPPKAITMCCRQIVEHKIQLIPPAKKGTVTVDKQIFTTIEKVCSEVVVIVGFIRKTVTYTAVIHNREIPNHSIQDDVPFQCLIESTDIKENHQFSISEQKVLSEVFSNEANFGKTNTFLWDRKTLAFNFIEKDIVKVSIKMIT